MTEQPVPAPVPQWDVADRMRKSLRHADIGVQEIADYLDVSRTTVSSWINGRITPSVQTLRLWAIRCGVDYEWLAGNSPPRPRRGGGDRSVRIRKPGRRWAARALAGTAA